jgi:hypothetical protein
MCLHTKKAAKIIEEENQDKPFEGENSPNPLAVMMAQAKAEHKKANGITTTGVLTSKKK